MVTMRTVGEILRQKRLDSKVELAEIALQTRIKVAYLQAIEAGKWSQLPPPPFTKGLIRNYAQALGLNPEEILAVFRREYDETVQKPSKSPFIMQSFVRFTPNTFLQLAIVIICLVFALYFFREFRILTGPPKLVVEKPQEQAKVSGNNVEIAGKTSAEAVVTVNGQPIPVAEDGSFATTIEMIQNGTVAIKATSKSGKSETVERTVMVGNSAQAKP